jgi:hypothetical protein
MLWVLVKHSKNCSVFAIVPLYNCVSRDYLSGTEFRIKVRVLCVLHLPHHQHLADNNESGGEKNETAWEPLFKEWLREFVDFRRSAQKLCYSRIVGTQYAVY